MRIIVQKFGGTSVQNIDSRAKVINHIKEVQKQGFKIVVVVSAMGRKGDPYATDTLMSLLTDESIFVSNREQDMMMSCGEIIAAVVLSNSLLANGVKATTFTGGQAGFRTTSEFKNAKIIDMRIERLQKELELVDVVVVTGFQGINDLGDTTTLGRGGSDTSATALGAALNAEYVDIFTDVEGMMTTDPRIVKEAQPISTISYSEVANMAYQGAKVIHPTAIEIAMQANLPIRIRSTFENSDGTLVTSVERMSAIAVKERLITGIAYISDIAQIQIALDSETALLPAKIFQALAAAKINVDFINTYPKGLQFTVSRDDLVETTELLESLDYQVQVSNKCAKISVVGQGVMSVPHIIATIIESLQKNEIPILQTADSHTTIWLLVNEADLVNAVNILHEVFDF